MWLEFWFHEKIIFIFTGGNVYGQSNDLKRHINKCHQEDNRPKKSIPMPPLATNIGGGPMELAPNLPS